MRAALAVIKRALPNRVTRPRWEKQVFLVNASTGIPALARESKHFSPKYKQIKKIQMTPLFSYWPDTDNVDGKNYPLHVFRQLRQSAELALHPLAPEGFSATTFMKIE